MQIVRGKEKLGNVLFAIGIIIELVIMITKHSNIIELPFCGRLTHVAFVFFGMKMLLTYYSKRQWSGILLFGILGTISYITCRDEYVIRAVMFVFASKDVEKKKILWSIFWSTFVGTVLIVLFACMGIAGEVKTVADFGRRGIETRYVLGFNHANNLHDMAWYLLGLLLVITHPKWTWKHYLLASLGNMGLFILTASRNGMMAIQLLLVACLVIHYAPEINFSKMPYFLGAVALGICLWMTWLGGRYGAIKNELVAFFDLFLNDRLEMVWEYAPVSKWEMFPEGRELCYVDNGFGKLFFQYGYVVGIIYTVVLLYMLYSLYKKGEGVACCVLVTTFLITFIESTFIFNTSLLCNMAFVVMINRWCLEQEKYEDTVG